MCPTFITITLCLNTFSFTQVHQQREQRAEVCEGVPAADLGEGWADSCGFHQQVITSRSF